MLFLLLFLESLISGDVMGNILNSVGKHVRGRPWHSVPTGSTGGDSTVKRGDGASMMRN